MPLHQRGLAHGDIRPARLWLEQGGNVKLLREPVSGFAPVYLSQPDASGLLTLRADYLAPNSCKKANRRRHSRISMPLAARCTSCSPASRRSRPPTCDSKMHLHATQPIQSLEAVGVPQPLAQVVAYLMAKNPAVRYQHLNQVIAQISPFVDPSRLNVVSPKPPATQAAYERAAATPTPAAGGARCRARLACGRRAFRPLGLRRCRLGAITPATAAGQGTPAATARRLGSQGAPTLQTQPAAVAVPSGHRRRRRDTAADCAALAQQRLRPTAISRTRGDAAHAPKCPRRASHRVHGQPGAVPSPPSRPPNRPRRVLSRSCPTTGNNPGSLRPRAGPSRCAICRRTRKCS